MSQYNNSYQSLGDNIVSALAYFFKSIVYILFVCPFEFWVAATNRLANDRKNCRIDILKNASRWPYLSFCKKIIFEFLIDGFIFISYFLGAIAALIVLVMSIYNIAKYDLSAWELLKPVGVLILTYYSPLGLSFTRDILTLLLLPLYKFISWVSKPAQQLDIDMRKHAAAPATAAPASVAAEPATVAAAAAPVFTVDAVWMPYVGTEYGVTHRLAGGQVEAFQPPYQTFELTSNGVFDGTFLGANRFETTGSTLRLFNGSRFLGDFKMVNPNNNGLVEIADATGIHYYLYRQS